MIKNIHIFYECSQRKQTENFPLSTYTLKVDTLSDILLHE